ncbi:MAG: hypothetical protein ACOVOV_08595, partial [Dolichospermum sp.]
TFSVNSTATAVTTTTGTVTVESGGRLVLNVATLDNADNFWEGIENFQNGSTVELQNWDWNNTTNNANRLVGNPSQISANSAGYLFGNLYFNANPSEAFNFIRGTTNSTLLLAENDLRINNASSFAVNLVSTNQNIEVGGSVQVDAGIFRLGAVSTSSLTHVIKGNLIVNGGSASINSGSMNNNLVQINVFGNITVASGGALLSGDPDSKFVFTGNTEQTISIVGTTIGSNVNFEVASGAVVKIINQNINLPNTSNNFNVLNGGSLNFQNFSIVAGASASPRFNTEAGATLITSNTAGLGGTGTAGSLQSFSSVSITAGNGVAQLVEGLNYVFNGATTTPFSAQQANTVIANNVQITTNI